MQTDEQSPVVIDNGTGFIKAGLAGEDAPSCQFPSCVGIPKYQSVMLGTDNKEFWVGDDAVAKKGMLNLKYPLEHGVINDWNDMERIWYHTFYNELRIDPSEHPCMLTEAPLNPKPNREKMTQIFFESFNVPSFTLQIQALLSLYAAGRCTGLVVDSGDGVTHTIPIYEGYALQHGIKRINLAGRDLTDYMQKILTESGITLTGSSGQVIARQIKEKTSYVAQNPEEESKKYQNGTQNDTQYELPDGQMVTIKDQQFRCPELLFNPMLNGKDFGGVHQLAFDSIQSCDIDVRKELFSNIILSGGTTMFKGFTERLENEIKQMAPSAVKVKCYAPPERQYSVWLGGSVLSSLNSFTQNWITKAEYEEVGVNIVHRKCF